MRARDPSQMYRYTYGGIRRVEALPPFVKVEAILDIRKNRSVLPRSPDRDHSLLTSRVTLVNVEVLVYMLGGER